MKKPSQRKKSQEERFLEKAYETALASGDPENGVDRYKVGNDIGENTRSVDNTVQMLTKNNFLKKGEGSEIFLTPLGVRYIQENHDL